MGKGDKKSKRGKIFAGSYGKSRPKKKNNKKSNENKETKDKE
jgi:30S ribosomal protein S31